MERWYKTNLVCKYEIADCLMDSMVMKLRLLGNFGLIEKQHTILIWKPQVRLHM